MKKQLICWFIASLVIPLFVGISKSTFGGFILILWPGAIMLLSLGAGENSINQVLYVWFMAVGSNIILYLFIGFLFQKIKNNT